MSAMQREISAPEMLRLYEGRAWASAGYPSWRVYVKELLGVNWRQSYRRLEEARVLRNLGDCGGVQPSRSIMRSLARLGAAEQRSVWRRAIAGKRRPTYGYVNATVQRRLAGLQDEEEVLFRNETEIEDTICVWLEREGVKYRRQVQCKAGIIDVLTDTHIYEIKYRLTRPELFCAAGQLFAYRQSLGINFFLVVVGVWAEPLVDLIEALDHCGVAVIELK